jgi:tRNA threonylcarbamoyladenosine biosynthesis protein TsaE
MSEPRVLSVEDVSREEVGLVALWLADNLTGGITLGLIGEMGAGKTTLIRELAEKLGSTTPVTSPTFALQRIHKLRPPRPLSPTSLIHYDLYRMESEDELRDLGFGEEEDENGLILVEWPDRFPPLLQRISLLLRIQPSPRGRSYQIEGPNSLLESWKPADFAPGSDSNLKSEFFQ